MIEERGGFMTPIRVEELQQDWSALDRLAQAGPVIVTRNGMPLFVVQEATPEWLEAWAEEMDVAGDMLLADYVKTNELMLDSDADCARISRGCYLYIST